MNEHERNMLTLFIATAFYAPRAAKAIHSGVVAPDDEQRMVNSFAFARAFLAVAERLKVIPEVSNG